MSWLKTAWDVSTDLVLISNLAGIRQSVDTGRQPSEEERTVALAVMANNAFLDSLKDMLCALRQSYEELTDYTFENVRDEAIAYQVLYRMSRQWPLAPSMFGDLYDKDYAASTLRLIRTRRRTLRQTFSHEDWMDVEKAVMSVMIRDESTARSFLAPYIVTDRLVEVLPLHLLDTAKARFFLAGSATVTCSKCSKTNTTNVWLCENCGKSLANERHNSIGTPAVSVGPSANSPAQLNTPPPAPTQGASWVVCSKCGLTNSRSSYLCANCGARLNR